MYVLYIQFQSLINIFFSLIPLSARRARAPVDQEMRFSRDADDFNKKKPGAVTFVEKGRPQQQRLVALLRFIV